MNPARLIAMLAGRPRSQTTTWNPADKAPPLTLSNGNLTATSDFASVTAARATTSRSTGKRSCRFTLDANGLAAIVGFANSSFPKNGTLFGADANGVGYRADTGTVRVNGVTLATLGTMVPGDVVDQVFDIAALLLWVRINGGAWNAGGAADPITGVGGIDVSSLAAGPYFPTVGFGSIGGDIVTASFWPSPPPGGVPAWDQ